MKLFIIGASGFIGGSLLKMAMTDNIEAAGTGYKRRAEGLIYFNMLDNNFDEILPARFKDAPGEVLAVICSANPLIEECRKQPAESYRLNVTSTKNLIKSIEGAGIKFCFLSTDNVYDGISGYYGETEPQCPCNEYGRQKAEIEKHILENHKNGLIFRLSQTLSNTVSEKHLFSQWDEWCRTKKEIMCIKDNIFSPTFVGDVYTALLAAFSKKAAGLYNCVNGEHFSREELARQFVRHLYPDGGVKITVKPASEFGFVENRALKTYLDNTKIVNELGIKFNSMKSVMQSFSRS